MSVNFDNLVDGGIGRFHGTAGGAVSRVQAYDTPCNIDESSISDIHQILWGEGQWNLPLKEPLH